MLRVSSISRREIAAGYLDLESSRCCRHGGDWRKTKIRKILRVHRSPNGYRLVARPIYEAGIVVFIGQSVNSSLYYAARYTCTPNESRPVPLNKIFLPAIGRYIGCISPVTNCLPIGQVCLARYNRSSIRQTFPLSSFLCFSLSSSFFRRLPIDSVSIASILAD